MENRRLVGQFELVVSSRSFGGSGYGEYHPDWKIRVGRIDRGYSQDSIAALSQLHPESSRVVIAFDIGYSHDGEFIGFILQKEWVAMEDI